MAKYLDMLVNSMGRKRIVSVDWRPGLIYKPVFLPNGRLVGLYQKTDEMLLDRIGRVRLTRWVFRLRNLRTQI